MRILLDLNVLLDIPFARAGHVASASLIARCAAVSDKPRDSGPRVLHAVVAWHSLATAAYLLEKAANTTQAREFLRELLGWATVAPASNAVANTALDLPLADLEDAMQVSSAIASQCQYVITRNMKDFVASPIPAITPESFVASFPDYKS